uniref:Ribosomal protein L19 n=1 Tax=Gastroclonium compressum TaxID=1852973 RepID=A0A173G090_GASCM|nr:ribosomal protein L19 [Coeloseira compressa]ANH09695.1 ribosomal protein L19 [Coeloseira compressa]
MNISLINQVEQKFRKNTIPNIEIGDSIEIGVLIQEGNKERIQVAQGVIIAQHKAELNTTITVRKILQNVGVERIYLIHSPRITYIKIKQKAKVKKAKLYYLRYKSGKATRLKQKFI